jgi:hypothetical protein
MIVALIVVIVEKVVIWKPVLCAVVMKIAIAHSYLLLPLLITAIPIITIITIIILLQILEVYHGKKN